MYTKAFYTTGPAFAATSGINFTIHFHRDDLQNVVYERRSKREKMKIGNVRHQNKAVKSIFYLCFKELKSKNSD